MIRTACPLDCYDACAITCDPAHPNKPIATEAHPMANGALCAMLNRYMHETPRIERARVDGKEVSMEEALDAIAESLKAPNPLLWRGSGNLGVMQNVTNLLMSGLGGTLTHGSLCDAAGQAGIEAGRGLNRILPPEQIAKADVVVVWGRNLTVTNAHLMPFIEGKKLVVIDPVKTPIAKRADLHIQLKPRTDFYLAIMLSRFNIMEDAQNDEWLESMEMDIDDFYDFTRSFRIKAILEYMGLSLDQMGDLLLMLQQPRVVYLVGNGVQKYTIGHYVLQAIDSLAATMGHFGKEGCGVSFLGNSRLGFDDPFRVKTDTVSIVTTPFEAFETVLVQGGNPAASMPNSRRVVESLKKVENLIYFGLYENETSELARIVLPAKTFLEKEDIRLSYGHQYVMRMNKVIDSDIGISEYDFTKKMFEKLGLEGLEPETVYLDRWLGQCEKEGEAHIAPGYEEIPYAEGFGDEGDEPFEYIDDFDDDFEDIKPLRKFRKKGLKEEKDIYRLLTPKSPHSLNTQFRRDDRVYLHPSLGYKDEENVIVFSEIGEHPFRVKTTEKVRPDCVLIHAGTYGVNYLTPDIESEEGDNACFQEVKVKIRREGEE
ncbi:molybdopterin-containing oxidoreductase family protein [Hydrogenimonas urashimensis]|uniref:molybdopterin-containing oxidoreductase family protein n=1 Tax=Hydrogenimonas urashimensis TaxID=2740515 RepID=UPI001914E5B2|nr:molybdopterin-dependent oxidoreductase [Hydrogenimonas urashimensis]